jgi:hypothetical protein
MPDPNDRRARVIDALTAGVTVTAAAQQCGVARRTLCYWLKDPAFQAAIADRRQRIADGVADELTDVALLALRTVKRCLAGEDRNDWNPFRVAVAKELVIAMGLMAVRPTLKSAKSGELDPTTPHPEGERRTPKALPVRDPRGDD